MTHIILTNPNTSTATTRLMVEIAGDAASPGTSKNLSNNPSRTKSAADRALCLRRREGGG